jgi:hypothetical protein
MFNAPERSRRNKMSNARRLFIVGAVLIGAGTLVVLRQVFTAAPANPQLWGLARWVTGTEFPGLPMIFAGALLLFATVFMRN